jgi:endonuclease/exonuclease/phosphatase (EEP) superfamily protein YafD
MVGVAREGTSGSAVFSRFPLREETLPAADLYFEAPVARVHAPAGDVVVLAAHSLPPLGVMAPVWRDELEALATLAADVPQATPLVMAGDFNASESHPGLRRLHDEGLRDAHREVGDGPLATWPSLGTPPILHIDHVLVRGLGVAHAGSASVAGSDHDAVWASLVLPGHVAAPVTARDRRAVGPSW